MATTTSSFYIYSLDSKGKTGAASTSTGSINTGPTGDLILGNGSSAETFTYSGTGGTVYTYMGTVKGGNFTGFYATSGGNTYVFSTDSTGSNANMSLTADTVGAGGADFTLCFYPGTLIATPSGAVAVDTLTAGDLVLTTDGQAKPIRWMGRQTVSTLFADPLKTLPVRIAAGALADNLPVRDLLVSPAHALAIDGVLVQAGALVNGTTITRETNLPAVFTYYHIELADQSLILAEGVPAETFIDNASREAFDNWEEHPALEAPMAELALPRAMAHRQVPMAIRQRIAARAAALLPQESAAA